MASGEEAERAETRAAEALCADAPDVDMLDNEASQQFKAEAKQESPQASVSADRGSEPVLQIRDPSDPGKTDVVRMKALE